MRTVKSKLQLPDGSLKVCRRIPVLLAALAFAPAYADIYVWQEAGGEKRMSNEAPIWYSASAPSRVRTQVLVNGHLVDDTGIAQPEREKLQATRAKAEAWGRSSPPPAAVAEVQPPPQDEDDAKPAKTAATATTAADIPAKALEGFKSVFEAKKLGESLIEEMKLQNRPR
ncbi:MAG: hypothetical protein HY017_03845 [Betaproteobacteria bacterium]|nr:hypothetical protein [Betaproteobacteria bacterium]